MNMRRFNLWLILTLSLLAGLTACSVSTANATPSGIAADVFAAQQLRVSAPARVTIVSELPGEIQVISYPGTEVAIDVVTTGRGATEDEALLQALQGSNLTLKPQGDGGALIQALPGESMPERILLHVRVPPGSTIAVEAPRVATNVIIAGETKDVKAQVQQGDISVRGATGDLNLRTERGSITVDEHDGQNHTLELHANTGAITLFALNARILASTTNGSIRFIGTLREANGQPNGNALSEFTVKGTGDITVALPDSMKFRYRAFGGARVTTDLAHTAEPCGFVRSPDYDFSRRLLSAGETGRIEVGGTFTNTSQVQGTVGNGIVYFETDRKMITIFDPPHPPARSGGPAASGFIGDCGRFTTENLAANVDFTARADSGSIRIRQIKMK